MTYVKTNKVSVEVGEGQKIGLVFKPLKGEDIEDFYEAVKSIMPSNPDSQEINLKDISGRSMFLFHKLIKKSIGKQLEEVESDLDGFVTQYLFQLIPGFLGANIPGGKSEGVKNA